MKIKRVISLIVIIAFMVTFMAGCAFDELTLLNALCKQPEITSSESRTDLTLNLSAEGLQDSDKESFNQIATLLNGMKFVINQKVSGNPEKTISKSQSDMTVDLGGITVSASAWTDTDLSGATPKINEIVKIPKALTLGLPDKYKGKPYVSIDAQELLPAESLTGLNQYSKEIMDYSRNLTPKLISFIKDYATQFDPGFPIVTRKDYRTIENQGVTIYNLKLDDAAFKKLLFYSVKNFAQSDKALNFIKDLAMTSTEVTDLSYRERLNAKSEINKSFEEFKTNLPEFLGKCDKMMEVLKDVKILGDKGIDIDFGINSEGFIVSESGTFDFEINIKDYMDAYESYNALNDPEYIKEENENEGIIKFGINYNRVYSKINKDVVIDFPALTKDNSFSLKDYLDNDFGFGGFGGVNEIGGIGESGDNLDYNKSFEEDVTPPAAPTVNKVLKTSKTVTGKAEAFSIVTVKKGSAILGESLADENGAFSVEITPVKTKCTLTVTAADFYGNESKATTVKVD